MDDVEENDIGEDYDADSDSDNLFGADNLYPDYSDENYEHQVNVLERQLPESGEAKIKKSQTWCKIQKVSRAHFENGYEFFPKSYTEYDCVPHIKHDSTLDNAIYSHDVCLVKEVRCKPLQKTLVYFKHPIGLPCALEKEKKTVNVGCSCINHAKYHFH
ncbi:hypothetical protein NQ317_012899 [Molorchus minor]|uniref:Prothoracicotropic hormone n=1 Tax=Molorchus minor TaxID=1323400 RepID=A0ABQ9JP71_9CUCU|nr:hypothetical protein NQ317_012899 [Molorchus minor]